MTFKDHDLVAPAAHAGIRYDERTQGTLQLFRTQQQLDGVAADGGQRRCVHVGRRDLLPAELERARRTCVLDDGDVEAEVRGRAARRLHAHVRLHAGDHQPLRPYRPDGHRELYAKITQRHWKYPPTIHLQLPHKSRQPQAGWSLPN